MTPCPHAPTPARTRRAMRKDPVAPRNVVVVLLDSLNRHMLGSYGGTEFETPHLDGFARERAVRFTSHVTGSLPCMPARHDILCGSLDFLWRPWGSIEVWEEPITAQLRRAGVTTMLVSDHPHLFEVGGENYHTDFSAWDYVRGHEGDPWRTYPDPSYIGAPALPARGGGWFWRDRLGWADAGDRPYDRSRTFFRAEEDFPGPWTMRTAAAWLRDGAPAATRPSCSSWTSSTPTSRSTRPSRGPGATTPTGRASCSSGRPTTSARWRQGRLSEREGRHIRANYGAKLSMIDHWAGEVFAALTERDLWDSTAVIVCTDHGHYLGEKDIWGKPGVMQYEPLGHTPLLVHWPGVPGGTECAALTTNVDIHATVADVFGVPRRGAGHGASLVPLLRGDDGRGAGVGHRRRLRKLGAGDGRPAQVRPRRRRRQLPALHVVQPLVHHARARAGGRCPPPPARPAGHAGLHAGVGRPGDPPTLRAGRPVAVLGRAATRWTPTSSSTSPRTPTRARTWCGTAVEADMVDLLRAGPGAVQAPGEQLERLGIVRRRRQWRLGGVTWRRR